MMKVKQSWSLVMDKLKKKPEERCYVRETSGDFWEASGDFCTGEKAPEKRCREVEEAIIEEEFEEEAEKIPTKEVSGSSQIPEEISEELQDIIAEILEEIEVQGSTDVQTRSQRIYGLADKSPLISPRFHRQTDTQTLSSDNGCRIQTMVFCKNCWKKLH
jgi:hypothetical protein